MSFLKTIINFITLFSLLVIFQSTMNFLNIPLSSYLIFLVWALVLILFYYILPNKYKYFLVNS